jgi:hypothetical protein
LLAPRRPRAVYRGDYDGILIDVDPATQTLTAVSVKAFDIVSLGGGGSESVKQSHHVPGTTLPPPVVLTIIDTRSMFSLYESYPE